MKARTAPVPLASTSSDGFGAYLVVEKTSEVGRRPCRSALQGLSRPPYFARPMTPAATPVRHLAIDDGAANSLSLSDQGTGV